MAPSAMLVVGQGPLHLSPYQFLSGGVLAMHVQRAGVQAYWHYRADAGYRQRGDHRYQSPLFPQEIRLQSFIVIASLFAINHFFQWYHRVQAIGVVVRWWNKLEAIYQCRVNGLKFIKGLRCYPSASRPISTPSTGACSSS